VVAVVVFSLLRLAPAIRPPSSPVTTPPRRTWRPSARGSASIVRSRAFTIWVGRVVRGDFGESFFFKKQVSS